MRLCFVFVIFCLVAILIFTVYLRSADSRIFYKLYTINTEQSRLNQQLGTKQLQVESLINPAAVAERLSGSSHPQSLRL